ncbi:hypothetical protein GHK62_19595 [Sinorhizobium terangae]|uniref:Uncharacterized protein n=1 Tax=Sinorhizobium terangae TaxID=110322 RepID=A0A6N7LG65_SINTE|nr:hypothetical protein [Sinorhizobium terangae]
MFEMERLLHVSLNRSRFKDKNMQQFKVLQRPLRVRKDARRCSAFHGIDQWQGKP